MKDAEEGETTEEIKPEVAFHNRRTARDAHRKTPSQDLSRVSKSSPNSQFRPALQPKLDNMCAKT